MRTASAIGPCTSNRPAGGVPRRAEAAVTAEPAGGLRPDPAGPPAAGRGPAPLSGVAVTTRRTRTHCCRRASARGTRSCWRPSASIRRCSPLPCLRGPRPASCRNGPPESWACRVRLVIGRTASARRSARGVIAPGPVSEMAGASSCVNSVVLSPLADLRVTHYSDVVPDASRPAPGQHDRRGDLLGGALRYPGFGELAADVDRFRRRRDRRGGGGRGATPAVEVVPLSCPISATGSGTTRPPGPVSWACPTGMTGRRSRSRSSRAWRWPSGRCWRC